MMGYCYSCSSVFRMQQNWFWRQILGLFFFHLHNRDLTCGRVPDTDTLERINNMTILDRMVSRYSWYLALFSEKGENIPRARHFLMHIDVLSKNVKSPVPYTQEDSNIKRSVPVFQHSTSFVPSPHSGTSQKLLSPLAPTCFSVSALAILLCFHLLLWFQNM